MRPTKNEAKIGISQCKDAIMNGLGKYSKQVFWQMEKVLQCMIKKEEVNVLVEAITERLELGEIVGDSDMDIITLYYFMCITHVIPKQSQRLYPLNLPIKSCMTNFASSHSNHLHFISTLCQLQLTLSYDFSPLRN